jgi:hypothetical protein
MVHIETRTKTSPALTGRSGYSRNTNGVFGAWYMAIRPRRGSSTIAGTVPRSDHGPMTGALQFDDGWQAPPQPHG